MDRFDTPDERDDHIRVIVREVMDRTRSRPIEIPAPMKWAAGVLAAIGTVAATSGVLWIASTVSDTQLTVARMDERLESLTNSQDAELADIKRRVTDLESYHRDNRGR